MSSFCCERDDINPAYVLTRANPDIPQDVLTHVLRHYQMSPRQAMARDHKKAVCSSILNMIRNILRNKNRCAMSGLLWIEQRERCDRRTGVSYVLSDVTCLFLSHMKRKIKSMRHNNTKLETIISLLNPGNIRWEMNRFNKNDVKGRYNLTYSFISRKLKQNTHLIHKH
jgi:hypothetical protein